MRNEVLITWPFYDREQEATITAELTIKNREMAQVLYNAMDAYGLNPTMHAMQPVPGGELPLYGP